MIKNCIVLFFSLLLITGCATNPKKIQAAYVSPLVYKDYDDEQIIMEMDYIGQKTAELYNSLASEAGADTAQMAIGLVLFWPALFFLEGGDGPEAAEYARLKGQYEALRSLAVRRKISLNELPLSPEQIVKDNSPRKSKVKSALNENRRD
jgi:hypothetical protein